MLLAITFAGTPIQTASHAQGGAPRRISNRDLLAYARAPFDKEAALRQGRVLLGIHLGIPVVAEFVCGDVCPNQTRRIIRYDVPVTECDRVGGTIVTALVPAGPSLRGRAVCTPPVLAGAKGAAESRARDIACPPGLVARLAGARDTVCASPEARARTRAENAAAQAHVNPAGAYGPRSCATGFVWREAHAGDLTCVSPASRAAALRENSLAAVRHETGAGPPHRTQ